MINRHVIPAFYRGRLRENPAGKRTLATEMKKLQESPVRFKKLPNYQRPSLQGTK